MARIGLVAGLAGGLLCGAVWGQQPAAPGKNPGGVINGTISGTIQGTPAVPGSTGSGSTGSGSTVPGVPGTSSSGLGGYRIISPLVQPTLSPGVVELMELEGRFSGAVAAGGGKVFSEWFADDAVVLSEGKPAMLGRGAIAAQAQWDPKVYQLTWVPEGAQMGPSNDMGFTWGRYEGKSTDARGEPVVTSGRYMTVWRKTKDSGWKVAMEASAAEPAAAGECCALPKP